MKCVLLFALVAVLVSGGQAMTCEEVASCTPDVSAMTGGQQPTQEDIKMLCKELMKSNKCFKAALDDCRKNKNMPAAQVDKFENQMSQYDSMMAQQCKEYTDENGVAETTGVSLLTLLASFFFALLL